MGDFNRTEILSDACLFYMKNRSVATSTDVFSFERLRPTEICEKGIETFSTEIIFVGAG